MSGVLSPYKLVTYKLHVGPAVMHLKWAEICFSVGGGAWILEV